jgi:AcrR family transcriptional regulator
MTPRGRPRDGEIDRAVLEVARRHLAERGFEAMSLAAVAADAGANRQAVYRRWPNKAELAAAAIASLADTAPITRGSAFEALVRELHDFRRGVSRPDGLSMVGTMLQGTTDVALRRAYRERIVAPRRHRLRAILQRGIDEGLLDPLADLDAAVPMLTGSFYGRVLAHDHALPHWPERTAGLIWRALGGTVP